MKLQMALLLLLSSLFAVVYTHCLIVKSAIYWAARLPRLSTPLLFKYLLILQFLILSLHVPSGTTVILCLPLQVPMHIS